MRWVFGVSSFIVFSFSSFFLQARDIDHLASRVIRTQKVETYLGVLKFRGVKLQNRTEFYLQLADNKSLDLVIPSHIRGVALLSRDKQVEVKAFKLKPLRVGEKIVYRLKVKNLRPKS